MLRLAGAQTSDRPKSTARISKAHRPVGGGYPCLMKSPHASIWPRFGRRTILLSILAPTLLVACRPSYNRDQVIGTFQASYDSGIQTLVIADDGSYVQTVSDNGRDPITNEGKWTWSESDDVVTLPDCWAVRDHDTGDIDPEFSSSRLNCSTIWSIGLSGSDSSVSHEATRRGSRRLTDAPPPAAAVSTFFAHPASASRFPRATE